VRANYNGPRIISSTLYLSWNCSANARHGRISHLHETPRVLQVRAHPKSRIAVGLESPAAWSLHDGNALSTKRTLSQCGLLGIFGGRRARVVQRIAHGQSRPHLAVEMLAMTLQLNKDLQSREERQMRCIGSIWAWKRTWSASDYHFTIFARAWETRIIPDLWIVEYLVSNHSFKSIPQLLSKQMRR
jgi:hypothetical protein